LKREREREWLVLYSTDLDLKMNVSVARPSSLGGARDNAKLVRQASTLAKGRFVKGRVQASTSRVQGSKKDNTGLLVASESESSSFCRREALALALALSTASGSANAAVPKGYSPVKNVQKGYAFLYPFGWQEVSVDGAEVTYKDIIEPLESISLEVLPSAKQSISEYGDLDALAATLVKEVLVPPNQEGTVLKATKRENEGVEYFTIEYTAKSRVFVRHSLTTLAVARGKLYTLTTGANERRWKVMKEKLLFVANSFTLL
jgi:photosystem II oxygen-evolving enhancer protein 2